jgi:hypothetical protein
MDEILKSFTELESVQRINCRSSLYELLIPLLKYIGS